MIDPEAVTSPANDRDSEHNRAPKDKERALRHIITVLYRSLSTAIYDAWLIAAEEAPVQRRAQRELLGLRAHLDLRLERAPDSDVLRKIWSRAGFLDCGVAFYLRPYAPHSGGRRNADVPPIAGLQDDQGLREIVALSACADAYRVIIGDTMEKIRTEEHAEHARDLKMLMPILPESTNGGGREQGEIEFRKTRARCAWDGRRRSGGHGRNPWKAGKSAARDRRWRAGMACDLGAAEVGVRRSKRQMTRELTTDVKWDVDRLERDLPVLLKRVKDAGFAPMFVLDELDKTRDANAALEKFLKLTKHIVTDHAAFLFLTDRDYYEQLIVADNIGAAR